MSGQLLQADELADKISKVLKEYEGVTEEAMEKAQKEACVEGLTELHGANPEGSGAYGSWNDYNKGWKVKYSKKKGFFEAIIYNATHYRLTHLLEHGHAKVNGGRTKAFPHIAPAEERCEKIMEEALIRELK